MTRCVSLRPRTTDELLRLTSGGISGPSRRGGAVSRDGTFTNASPSRTTSPRPCTRKTACPPALRLELGDDDLDLHGVADFHRCPEVEGLAHIDGAGPGKTRAEHGRDQARRIETMRDACAEGVFAAKCSDRWMGLRSPVILAKPTTSAEEIVSRGVPPFRLPDPRSRGSAAPAGEVPSRHSLRSSGKSGGHSGHPLVAGAFAIPRGA